MTNGRTSTAAPGTALITGGASGIGFALARAHLDRGGKAALIGTDPDRLDAALGKLGTDAGRAGGFVLDVRDGDAWPATADAVEERLGPVTLLALNAGAQSRRVPIEVLRPDDWRLAWGINVDGVLNGLRAVLPRMKARTASAHILIVSSLGALVGRPLAGAYDATKAAVLTLAESLRSELATTPIGVSVLCPGPVRTEFAATALRHTSNASPSDFAFMADALTAGLDPADVARFALDRAAAGAFYVFTHPELAGLVRQRLGAISAALDIGPVRA